MDPENNTGANGNDSAAGNQEGAANAGDTGAVQNNNQPTKETTVPVSVLSAMRDELKAAKAAIAAANRPQGGGYQQQQAPPQQQQTPNQEDLLADRPDDDLISVADVRKILNHTAATNQNNAVRTNAAISSLTFAVQNPDYHEVMGRLKSKMASDPAFANTVTSAYTGAQNPLAVAYAMGKLIPAENGNQPGSAGNEGDVMSQIEKILANAEKPGNPNAFAGASGFAGSNKYSTMSDTDFEKQIAAVKGA